MKDPAEETMFVHGQLNPRMWERVLKLPNILPNIARPTATVRYQISLHPLDELHSYCATAPTRKSPTLAASSNLGWSSISKLHKSSLNELQCSVSTGKTHLEFCHSSRALGHIQNKWPTVSSSWLQPSHRLSCNMFLRIRFLFVGKMSRQALRKKCLTLGGIDSYQISSKNLRLRLSSEHVPSVTALYSWRAP